MKESERDNLIQSLKTAKVEKDRKWIYNLIAWAIKNQDKKEYQKFQIRIQSAIHYAKGKYQSYWDNPRNKAQHDKSQAKCLANNTLKYEEMSIKYHLEQKIAYQLFKEGKLSQKSTALIESEMGV